MQRALKFILPPIVVALGVAVLVVLVKTKPQPAKASTENPALLVSTTKAVQIERSARVYGQGTVIAARQVTIQPQVSGELIEVNPKLVAGGRVKKDEVLARINPRDYRLRVQQSGANVQQAQFNLDVEQGRRKVAEREWDLVGNEIANVDEAGRQLALRRPHQRNARASLAGARSGLALARLNLERTVIRAPFNALVLNENADVGQVAAPGAPLATLVGSDEFWIRVSVPVEELSWLKLPGPDGEGGSMVDIEQRAGEATVKRTGRVLRLLGDVDPVGRMARVIIAVDNPMGEEGKGLPLLLGAFVNVEAKGRAITNAIAIPREALRPNDTVWVMTPQKTLEIRKVEVALRQRDDVLIQSGLKPGDAIITSRIETPVSGMPVRTGAVVAPQPTGDGEKGAEEKKTDER